MPQTIFQQYRLMILPLMMCVLMRLPISLRKRLNGLVQECVENSLVLLLKTSSLVLQITIGKMYNLQNKLIGLTLVLTKQQHHSGLCQSHLTLNPLDASRLLHGMHYVAQLNTVICCLKVWMQISHQEHSVLFLPMIL